MQAVGVAVEHFRSDAPVVFAEEIEYPCGLLRLVRTELLLEEAEGMA